MTADAARWPGTVVLLPLVAAVAASLLRHPRTGGWLAIGGATAAFAGACALPWQMQADALLLVDPLSALLAVLVAFVGMTAAWSVREHNAPEQVLVLLLLGALLLAVLANDMAVTWLAMAAATIAGAAALILRRTQAAVAAGWRFFLLGGVGLALALFGTVLLYRAAAPVLGPGPAAMNWSAVADAMPAARTPLPMLAFLLLLLGYGTFAALAPLHTWLPEAEAAASAPLAALLGGAMPAVALAAILRARALTATGWPLLVLGLTALLFGAFALWRQRDLRGGLACAGIAQTGAAAFAFGLGGAAATFAGILHLALLLLARTAALPLCDAAPGRLRRLTLAAAIAALAFMPPFGLFTSVFLIVGATARQAPWLLPPLLIGLVVLAWALTARLVTLLAVPAARDAGPPTLAALVPAWLSLGAVLLLGLAMPGGAVAWLAGVARTVP